MCLIWYFRRGGILFFKCNCVREYRYCPMPRRILACTYTIRSIYDIHQCIAAQSTHRNVQVTKSPSVALQNTQKIFNCQYFNYRYNTAKKKCKPLITLCGRVLFLSSVTRLSECKRIQRKCGGSSVMT